MAIPPQIVRSAGAPFTAGDHALAQTLQGPRQFTVVLISNNALPSDYVTGLAPKPVRCLLVFETLPLSATCIAAWREWADGVDLKMLQHRPGASAQDFSASVRDLCAAWYAEVPQREPVAVERGKLVSFSSEPGKHDPALLTMLFGSMGDLLRSMDGIERRFTRALGKIELKQFDEYRESIKRGLAPQDKRKSYQQPSAPQVLLEQLPRVLLLGETGVGKTLFAHQLSGKGRRPFRRVPVPEYLGKEDMFEYDLFGYAHGAYTGGREAGDVGHLLSTLGGVVFIDEIGTASSVIQAKLLAYLDDYRVRPRGWSGEAFPCPALLVAATNLTLEELNNPQVFRADLLARFTDIVHVPPLRDRMRDLPFILDCLLQSEAINPGGLIKEIGLAAFEKLKGHRFRANFRELETMMRQACGAAAKDHRNYVCTTDFAL